MIARLLTIMTLAMAGLATAHAADIDAATVSDKGVGAFKAACIDTGGDFAKIDAAAAGMGWRKLTEAEVAEMNATQLQSRMPVLAASAWGGEFEGVPMWLYATDRGRTTDKSADDRMRRCAILAPPGDQPAIRSKLKAVCPGKVTSDGALFGGVFLVMIERVENGMKIGCDYIGGRAIRIPSFDGGKPYDVFSYNAFRDPKRE
jgi:hypothetical protein